MYLSKMTLGLILVSTLFSSCGNVTKPNPNNRNYEDAYRSSSTVTSTVEDNPYIDNHLQTGAVPYDNASLYGSSSTITVSTSENSECDVVVIIKHNGNIVPNGTYQVFFYGGRGWNPNKKMAGGNTGGFVANESFSKDSQVTLDYQGLNYELIPQQNGNFSTMQSSENEVF